MYESSDIELVRTLITKTSEKNLIWKKGFSDWIFYAQISGGFCVNFEKYLSDFSNSWCYVLTLKKSDINISEAVFIEPSRSILPNTYINSLDKDRDYKLVEELFEIVKQEVNNSLNDMKLSSIEALKSMQL